MKKLKSLPGASRVPTQLIHGTWRRDDTYMSWPWCAQDDEVFSIEICWIFPVNNFSFNRFLTCACWNAHILPPCQTTHTFGAFFVQFFLWNLARTHAHTGEGGEGEGDWEKGKGWRAMALDVRPSLGLFSCRWFSLGARKLDEMFYRNWLNHPCEKFQLQSVSDLPLTLRLHFLIPRTGRWHPFLLQSRFV